VGKRRGKGGGKMRGARGGHGSNSENFPRKAGETGGAQLHGKGEWTGGGPPEQGRSTGETSHFAPGAREGNRGREGAVGAVFVRRTVAGGKKQGGGGAGSRPGGGPPPRVGGFCWAAAGLPSIPLPSCTSERAKGPTKGSGQTGGKRGGDRGGFYG